MKRRKFIALSALTAASVSLPFLHCAGSDSGFDKKLSVPQTLSQLVDDPAIREIGKSYSSLRTDEYSLKTLEQLLVKNNEGKTISSNSTANDIYHFLEKKILDDFDSDRTVIVNGWVLSLTEARQSALFSLIPNTK